VIQTKTQGKSSNLPFKTNVLPDFTVCWRTISMADEDVGCSAQYFGLFAINQS
jgi:hypothetical protein